MAQASLCHSKDRTHPLLRILEFCHTSFTRIDMRLIRRAVAAAAVLLASCASSVHATLALDKESCKTLDLGRFLALGFLTVVWQVACATACHFTTGIHLSHTLGEDTIREIPVREPRVQNDHTRPDTVLPTIQPSLRRQFFHTVASFLFSSFGLCRSIRCWDPKFITYDTMGSKLPPQLSLLFPPVVRAHGQM